MLAPAIRCSRAPDESLEPNRLRRTARRSSRIVILAWCYSLFAMKPGWDQNVKNTWPQVFLGPNMTPIAWTARDWDWVSTYGLLPAAVAAEHEAVA